MDFKSKWKNIFGDNYSFRAGEGILERLNEFDKNKLYKPSEQI